MSAHSPKGPGSKRLTAAERRADLLRCASRTFSRASYRGTTTAEIARSAGVTEPILYRHFASKRDLYLACLADAWERVRAGWEEALASEVDPADWLPAMGRVFRQGPDRVVTHNLWVQAIAEASGDPVIRAYMQRQMREVHDVVEEVIRRSQAQGGIEPERDASAEAWVFLGIGFLNAVSGWLGGLIEDDVPGIAASRRRWLTGRP